MNLVFDERMRLGDNPGFHALIVGVSAYPHLPGGTGPQASDSFGMQQLSCAALSAFRLYEWLLSKKDKLSQPLATCRLLLSPSRAELDASPELKTFLDNHRLDGCSLESIQSALKDWRKDNESNEQNVALFYFVGHGVQRSKGDSVLLLEDFGDGRGGTLAKSVNVHNIYYGMSVSGTRPQIAQTQFYFIDACRVLPSAFKDFEKMETGTAWDTDLPGRDLRSAPIFYASVPGNVAYAMQGQPTIFNQALLACLKGGAARPPDQETGQERWTVTHHSISDKLDDLFQTLNPSQKWRADGFGPDAVIVFLDGPPLVDVSVEVIPSDAASFVELQVVDSSNHFIWRICPVPRNPYTGNLPAGYYLVGAEIEPPRAGYQTSARQIWDVKPPSSRRSVKVIP